MARTLWETKIHTRLPEARREKNPSHVFRFRTYSFEKKIIRTKFVCIAPRVLPSSVFFITIFSTTGWRVGQDLETGKPGAELLQHDPRPRRVAHPSGDRGMMIASPGESKRGKALSIL